MSEPLVARSGEEVAAEGPVSEVAEGDLVPLDAVQRQPVALRPDPLYHGVLLAMCSAIVVLSFLLSVRNQTRVVLPWVNVPLPELCMMRRMTGLGCPGCGMTRCFISLARGDVAAAWSYNPAGLLMFAVIAFQIPFRSLQLWRIRRGLPELRTGLAAQIILITLAAAMIGQWALRLAGVQF
jgi:hypothetical protein